MPLSQGGKGLTAHSLTEWYGDGLCGPNGQGPNGRTSNTEDFLLTDRARPCCALPSAAMVRTKVPHLNLASLPAPCSPIDKESYYEPSSEKLTLSNTPMTDYSQAKLMEAKIAHQLKQFLRKPTGKPVSKHVLDNGWENPRRVFPRENFSASELKSWQAACTVNDKFGFLKWNDETWPHLGSSGLDLYWTTRRDGCRYEYWSSNPGHNEYGVLVRVDAETATGIALGGNDGLSLVGDFADELQGDEVVQQIFREGWPCFR